ncbi:putative COP9 signalosome complex subunit 3 [Colletotrichum truncatum]|uniref:COP9 signalosome complex subunit 3 n=1 Tax=Colletotrichum truncatum TaxID=5467 RepID=A0ACC3ZED1_COLTU|nr:putative COP9 signalosome complex subunit 3 [Colletotrichum truncatum]KAF6801379.1 putative COP9 signalosome complex subunit 3 [Colletotrichum truncatum]
MDATFLSFEHEQYATDEIYDKAVKNHIAKISRLFKDQGSAVVANAPQLLEIVHPTNHSISHLAILNTLKHYDETARPISPDAFREYILRFLLSFDQRQIRYIGDVFYDLVKDVVECKYFPARQAIEIVAIVLRRLDPDSAVLTSIHTAVIKLAYETDNIDQALPIIEKPWVFLPGMKNQSQPAYLCDRSASPAAYINSSTHLTHQLNREDVMQHEYLTAQIFTAKLRWLDAFKAYQRIITWPARDGATSKIMTEAHKRWILTGLLSLGQTPTLPNHISPAATKSFTSLSKPYADVAALFSTTNAEQFKAEIDKGIETWNADQTTTLLKEVVKAYQQWQILGLADVYHKISVSEIRQNTLSAETASNLETDQQVEELLLEMINSGMLQGVLETSLEGAKCLTFLPRDQEIEYNEYQRKIKDDARIHTLNKWTQTSDARLAASKDYAKHIIREQKRQDKDGQSQNAELGFDASIEDEDLMTGIQHP